MEKKLNIELAKSQMENLGLSAAGIARELAVSRTIVSDWLREEGKQKFPRAGSLLKLGKLLKLSREDLVIKTDPNEPVIAFRKRQGTKTKDIHIDNAKSKGRYLSKLIPFLPYETLEMPPVFKAPSCDYKYLQEASVKVRKDINLTDDSILKFDHLIERFNDLQAVIVPVLWGKQSNHANAIHIYLPESQTTWVYLNLDTNLHDFKFWMAHELGHCLSPNLSGDEAEDFADSFAGALLFPENKARDAYGVIASKKTKASQVKEIIELAKNEYISPISVLKEVNAFASHYQLPELDLFSPYFYAAVGNFNKAFENVSIAMFEDLSNVSSKQYVAELERVFRTPFFNLLRQYLKVSDAGSGFMKTITEMPLLDVKSLYEELKNAPVQNIS
jgi:Zn-dependent peptidase ImmA (M78 family)